MKITVKKAAPACWLMLLLVAVAAVLVSGESACVRPGGGSDGLTVVLIRHGEKPDGGDHLSCQGLNRALALPGVLYPLIGRPDICYVPSISQGASVDHARMLETVMPFAVKYDLRVSDKYGVDDVHELAHAILGRKGTVLVVWEHARLNSIASDLGADQFLPWASDDFDSIWIITFHNGKAHLEKKKEGLNPAAACAF